MVCGLSSPGSAGLLTFGVRFQGWVCLSSRVLMAWLQLCVRVQVIPRLNFHGNASLGAGSVERESERVLHENINL